MNKTQVFSLALTLAAALGACSSQNNLEQEEATPEGQAKAQEVRGLMDQQIQRQQQVISGTVDSPAPEPGG